MKMSIRLSLVPIVLAVGAAVLGFGACTARIDTRGNLPDPDQIAQIKPGESNRSDVSQILGSPSTISNFDNEAWYYISNRTETTAFFEPKVEDRKILIVRFDKSGQVAALETRGLEAGKEIEPVDRATPTAGNEFTLLQQLFGNLGKFNASKK